MKLVCCAHGLAFDTHVHEGIRFVMSGGGGSGLCSHYRGVCTEGSGHPEDRGGLFHAVVITVTKSGEISGRVMQAFGQTKHRPLELLNRDGAATNGDRFERRSITVVASDEPADAAGTQRTRP